LPAKAPVAGLTTIKGIANITGGAFYDKIRRILPAKVSARINKGSWPVPQIFKLIQNKGNIEDREIYRTLNMGIGMVMIMPASAAKKVVSGLQRHDIRSWIIGEIASGNKEVVIT
jgi:phosphoribosylformylglycinamidine cyclo-ligase